MSSSMIEVMLQARLHAKVVTDTGQIAVWRWENGRPNRQRLLLVHGTGFVSQVWQAVAENLAVDYEVYAIDRRGHGESAKPDDAYHFLDFAEDLCAVVDDLDLDFAGGIGHSAGATDVLLAAALRPRAFGRVFAMEPTLMEVVKPASPASDRFEKIMDGAERRRVEFESKEEVVERYGTRAAFAAWHPQLLELYVEHGFEQTEDGTVRLRCTPTIELAMLVHIVAAMDNRYEGDHRGNPFPSLGAISCPVCIATTERSGDIYKSMAARARRLISSATTVHFEGVGHSAPQEAPDSVAREIKNFLA